jgi:hypothetical protein
LVSFYREKSSKFQEPTARAGVISRLDGESGEVTIERGNRAMWISLFTFAAGAAVCLTIAAVMMQSAGQRTLRG